MFWKSNFILRNAKTFRTIQCSSNIFGILDEQNWNSILFFFTGPPRPPPRPTGFNPGTSASISPPPPPPIPPGGLGPVGIGGTPGGVGVNKQTGPGGAVGNNGQQQQPGGVIPTRQPRPLFNLIPRLPNFSELFGI